MLDAITTLIYIADIALSFRTTYLDNFGDEITDGKRIAIHYLKSQSFWVDSLSLLANPLTAQVNSTYFTTICSFFGMFKIVRFFRFK
jgi:hypothetical protein